MESWSFQEYIDSADLAEPPNGQFQLNNWCSPDAILAPLENIWEVNNNKAEQLSSMHLGLLGGVFAVQDVPAFTIIVPPEESADVKPSHTSRSKTSDTSLKVTPTEFTAPPSVKFRSSSEESASAPQLESVSHELASIGEAVEAIADSLSSPESQLHIVTNTPNTPEQNAATVHTKQAKAEPTDVSRKRAKRKFVPNEAKDEDYWAKRNKNNEAARRSRATAKEKKRKDQLESMTIRNTDLKSRYMAVCVELQKLKCEAKILGLDLEKL